MRTVATSIAAELRASGLPAQSDISGRSLRKILESQSAIGTKAVVIVGEKELASDSVKLKWMDTGEEKMVRLSELGRAISEKLH